MECIFFYGKQIIKPEDLSEADRVVTINSRNSSQVISDKTKIWKGKYLKILILENQSYIDYRMVIRNMLLESANYNKQWRDVKNKYLELKDLSGDEFLSGMSKII